MADDGFTPQVEWILRHCTGRSQTMLFSATLDGDVGHLIRHYLTDPIEVAVDSATGTVGTMHHLFLAVHHMDKDRVIGAIAQGIPKVLVFCQTKRLCDRVTTALDDLGVSVAAIHGDLPQPSRERAMRRFAEGKLAVLVATDVAARGIDIDDIGVVIHYEPAKDAKDYLHRSGRTARAGRDGWAITFVEYNQHTQMRILQRGAAPRRTTPPVEVFSNNPNLRDLTLVRSRRQDLTDAAVRAARRGSRSGARPAGRASAREPDRAVGLVVVDVVGVAQRDADVVEAVEEPLLGRRVHRERLRRVPAAGTSTTRRSTSTTISVCGSASIAAQIASTVGSGSTTATSPFLAQLLRKMSEKLGAITASNPYCWIAHTACSRIEPMPNDGPATSTRAPA